MTLQDVVKVHQLESEECCKGGLFLPVYHIAALHGSFLS